MQNHFKIIVPFYNVEKWIKICIRSIKAQTYKNFQCILIDDFSDDNTESVIIKEISGDSRFSLARPQEKAYALKNIYDGIAMSNPDDEDIIVTLDGDDWFANKNVLETLNKNYNEHDCWITYGSYAEYPSGNRGKFARNIDFNFIQNKILRNQQWMSSHLRTFKYKLWKRIDKKDLLDEKGNFYRMAWDLAFMFPMLEMAGKKSLHIEDILYVYNMSNPMNDHKIDNTYQRQLEMQIRTKPPYERIDKDRFMIDPSNLWTHYRFDIGAKVAYGRDYLKNVECDWTKKLYLEHLRAWNNFQEKEPKKEKPEDFINSFIDTISSLSTNGFLAEKEDEKIPVVELPNGKLTPLNGAHRVACGHLFGPPESSESSVHEFPVTISDVSKGQINCGFEYFKNKNDFVEGGIAEEYLDYMNLEFILGKCYPHMDEEKGCKIVTLFPSANITLKKAIGILSKYCSVVSYKTIDLNQLGQFNYIMTLYFGEPWLGNIETNNWPGAVEKHKGCFDGTEDLRIILVYDSDYNKLRKAKEEIREICQKGNHSIHICDTNTETWRIATSVYNKNSIHFLNNSKIWKTPSPFLKFFNQFSAYTGWQSESSKNWTGRGEHGMSIPPSPTEDFAIDASSVLSAYGIREGSDLDFLYGPHNILTGVQDVNCHNLDSEDYEESIHEIIYNPNNHFWFFGRKFATLEVVKKMKQNRNEPKDQVDVKLIDEVLSGS